MAQGQNQTYHTVTPYLIAKDATALINFLKNAFHGEVTEHMTQPDGRVMHAEVKVGDSIIMMGEAMEDNAPFPAMLYVYMKDTDGAYKSALAAGATSIREPKNEFYGHRTASVRDSQGNVWWLWSLVEELSPEELQRRVSEMAK